MRKTLLNLAASAALLLAPALSLADSYTFSGQIDDGPLVGQAISGSFEFDASSVTPAFTGDLPLVSFAMLLAGQNYTLVSADAAPVAVYFEGSFMGLSYVDADAVDPLARPIVALVPGFLGIGDAYLAYDQSTDPGAGLAGFGSFSVAVVPEPAALLLILVDTQPVQVEHAHAAVLDPDHPFRLQGVERLVHALARQAHQVAQFLLRDAQQRAHPGVEHRVEECGQVARHTLVGVGQAVDLARCDELAQPLVELHHHEAVEADAAVQQPLEGVGRDAGHHALAQGLDVVAVGLVLQHRALAEPAA
jgi:hypothetical protein